MGDGAHLLPHVNPPSILLLLFFFLLLLHYFNQHLSIYDITCEPMIKISKTCVGVLIILRIMLVIYWSGV